jgi:hypothetical protein
MDLSMTLELIEVNELRIVKADSSVNYVTLSYVWGQSREVLQLNKDNQNTLRQPDALRITRLTTVVEDAIHLVKSIGERYLWVDALCVPQNDNELTAFYVDRMDQIYSQSILTIVAASTVDASDTLPGVRPYTRPPLYSRDAEGIRFVKLPLDFPLLLRTSVYESRAWTFQERLLSTRSVIFIGNEVFLSCPSKLRSESVEHSALDRRRLQLVPSVSIPLGDHPQDWILPLTMYRDLVVAYTKKRLTFDGDILRAFAGISATLESKHALGTMFLGIPAHGLPLALTWVSIAPLTRRSECIAPFELYPVRLPSWTWAAWTGKIIWPFSFRLLHTSISANKGMYFRYTLLIDHVEIGTEVDGSWYVHRGPRELLHASSAAPAIPFTALTVSSRSFTFQASVTNIFDYGRETAFSTAYCPWLEILYNSPNPTCNDGCTFGASLEQTQSDDLVFIALASDIQKEDVNVKQITTHPDHDLRRRFYHNESTSRPTGNTDARDQYPLHYDRYLRYIDCIVVRWLDEKKYKCERVGVVRVAGDIWQLKSLEKVERNIHLV